MGCDIHGVFQRKEGAAWTDIESLYDQDRDYRLFSMLAGVRNSYDIEPIALPRGLPLDLDFDFDGEDHAVVSALHICSRRRSWLEDGDPLVVDMGDHSFTWLGSTEMLSYAARLSGELKAETSYFFDEIARLVAEHGDVRFVFGFDN
jgi:hypothetical protein